MLVNYKIKIYALFLAAFMSGCANVSPSAPKNTMLTKQSKTQATTSLEKDKIQNWGSKTFYGKTGDRLDAQETALLNLLQGYIGKRDGGDCSGFVTLVNKKLNRDFFDEKELDKFYTKHGLKSEAMFKLYESKNLIAFDDPKVGDLVFFNNTTRSTKNNKKAKIITHVGIVSSVEKDGTVGFTHHARGKNAVDFMNLKNNNTSCLASNRFAGFGKASIRRN